MGNLAAIKDPSALQNRYLDKIIVYVEGEGDRRLFMRIVGPDFGDRLEFRTPVVAGGGCRAVIKRVQTERPSNDKIYGLVDGETSVELGGIQDFVSCREHLFGLPAVAEADGIIFLAGHELENLILMHSGVCDLISKNVQLAHLGNVQAAAVEATLLKQTRRFLLAALLKYAVFILAPGGAPTVKINSGQLIDPSTRLSSWLGDLRAAVLSAGGSWPTYRTEAKSILADLLSQLKAEAVSPADRNAHLVRLADGKNLLKGLQVRCNSNISEGLLSDALTRPPYAQQFREELFARTGAA